MNNFDLQQLFKLTYKQLNKLVIVGFILMVVVIGLNIIQPSINQMNGNKSIKEKIDASGEAELNLKLLKTQLNLANKIIGNTSKTGKNNPLNSFEENPLLQSSADKTQNILTATTQLCHEYNLVLKALPKTIENHLNKVEILTKILTLQGSFNGINNCIFQLENTKDIGKVKSIHYSSKFNYKTNSTELTCQLYINNYKLDKHEDN